ncbi:hypothetical protein EDD21DRAFT_366920 [Dissophora ornata]|nr:hypothetical protein BGZ58_009766 [Dissophora ornata]KAI8604179.1 hypothetical protein EDD21DRAFT_366920 [Dissophora ornata]
MEELELELFGPSDSDPEDSSEHSGTSTHLAEVPQCVNNDLSMETDPIFRSIMESSEDPDTDTLLDNQSRVQSLTLQPRHEPHPNIPGLSIHTNVLSHADQSKLMSQITEKNFFKGGKQNQAMCFGKRDLAWLTWLEERMFETGVLEEPHCRTDWTSRAPLFDQSIMNLYYPGNGIKPHVDLARFEDGIIVISLLSAINMDFYLALNPMAPEDPPEGASLKSPGATGVLHSSSQTQRQPSFTVRLESGSVISIQGPARYEWEHGIQETTQDLVHGEWVRRKVRVSVTLRKMRTAAWEVGPSSLANGAADRK